MALAGGISPHGAAGSSGVLECVYGIAAIKHHPCHSDDFYDCTRPTLPLIRVSIQLDLRVPDSETMTVGNEFDLSIPISRRRDDSVAHTHARTHRQTEG